MYVVGCKKIEEQIREINTNIHICGHTHIDHDVWLDNVRYVQHAGGHPSEKSQWWKTSTPYEAKVVAFL